jgi:hypothetical protein
VEVTQDLPAPQDWQVGRRGRQIPKKEARNLPQAEEPPDPQVFQGQMGKEASQTSKKQDRH